MTAAMIVLVRVPVAASASAHQLWKDISPAAEGAGATACSATPQTDARGKHSRKETAEDQRRADSCRSQSALPAAV